MDKSSIRVIKRNNIAASAKVPVTNATAPSIIRHKRIDLDNWVAESRDAIRLEKAFDQTRMLGWNTTLPRRK